MLRLHPNPVYKQIGNSYDIHWGQLRFFDTMRQGVFGNNTHVYLIPCIRSWMLKVGVWYRSRESVEGDLGYGGFMTRKDWKLNEV